MRFYPCVPTRRVGGRKGLRLAISDLVTVSVEPGGKRIPIDALPVAARRVLHHEASGDHERVVACLAHLARERPLLVRNLDLCLLLLALKPEPGSVGMVKNEGRRFCVTPRPGRVALVVHTVVTLELGYVSIVGAVPTRCIADCICA